MKKGDYLRRINEFLYASAQQMTFSGIQCKSCRAQLVRSAQDAFACSRPPSSQSRN
jgi:hypothetical protein